MHKLFQVIDRHVLEVDLFSTVDVGGVGKDADGHPRPGNIREPANVNQILHEGCHEPRAHLTVPEKRLSLWGS